MNVRRRTLTASREIKLPRMASALTARLVRRGMGYEDARVIAHNAAAVFGGYRFKPPALTPGAVLRRLSLDELAALCERLAREQEEEL